MEIKGFKRALLSTLRSGMLYHQHDVYLRVGQQERSILLLWGKEDQTIPLSIGEQVKETLPHADFRIIDQAGHVPHYELPDLVNPILIDFLNER
jgi:pimeloyl-ACP methyl ester carboxylesterase